MILHFDLCGENKTLRIYALPCRGIADIHTRATVVLYQPENALRYIMKQPHPDIEDLRSNFPIMIETAEYESIVWQSDVPPRELICGNISGRIVCLIAIGQMDYFLRAKGLLIEFA